MADPTDRIRLTKLDVAHRELRAAIRLWFDDGEPVAVHLLATAAYEIIHVVSKRRNRRRTLLLDSIAVRNEYRKEWINTLRSDQNFFKHADRDSDGVIKFVPQAMEFFVMFSVLGLSLLGEEPSDEESAFMF